MASKILKTYIPRKEFLPFSPPNITKEEIDAVVEVLRSGWISAGPRTQLFENAFAKYIGIPDALALSSCTGGLHLALAALGVGPGDEVITTTMTFCSSVHVIEHVGATPILVDIDPKTLTLDPERVKEAITSRTRVIMPVHLAGHPVDMQPILELARQYNLFVVEDAAHAIPACYEGRMVGAIGDLTAFSFYATKNMTTGEGGMLTGKPEYIDRARLLSMHGMNRDAWKRYSSNGNWYYEVIAAGFKYNMSDIQAALGLVQLTRLDEMQKRRYEIVKRYKASLASISQLQLPMERENVQHAWHLYILRLNLDQLTIDRGQFINELKQRNIGTSVHFIPVHMHPYYAEKYNLQPETLPVAYHEYQRMLSLPLHSGLSDEDITDIIASVLDVIEKYKC
jgi:dTDP-4-amino-4,6-dideoxygalactose transaminase